MGIAGERRDSVRPRVIVAQVGARRNYAVARALYQRGSLSALYTDFCLYGWRAQGGTWLLRREDGLGVA